MIEPLGVSRDTPPGILPIDVVSVHSVAINCMDERKRRWTLIADEAEFQPRSILVERLPVLKRGEKTMIDASLSPRVFDPRFRQEARIFERWFPLLCEWAEFIDEPELEVLGREASVSNITALSGMGPGLTPAGDDFIAGWLTALRVGRTTRARKKIRAFYTEWEPEKTTWLSKWMIIDAMRGKIWARGKNLLRALKQEEGKVLTDAVSEILNWGHTSGRAWLAGLARGLIE